MRVSEIEVISPKSILECLSYLAESGQNTRIIAGGTDTVVQMKEGKGRPEVWLNINSLKELRYIRDKGEEIHIGPLTTHSDIVKSMVLKGKADALVEASKEVGATQIRNMGTIGGNIATASPAGDTIPALYVLDTEIELQSLEGKRRVKIEDFFYGPRRTELKANEMITNIIIKPQLPNEISIFQKLGPRRAQAISIVNVAIRLSMGEGERECLRSKIAFGSVGPTITRAKKCENMATSAQLTDDLIRDIGLMAWNEVAPISDIRASAAYRKDMANTLLVRGLYRLIMRWENR